MHAAAQKNEWNGKKCAVVFTYDDGLNIHLSNVVPALDSQGLKGTFYICDDKHIIRNQVEGWRMAAANGHELANHSILHPCEGGPGREWLSPDRDMRAYSVKRMDDDITVMNDLLFTIDGKTRRTFAYPCGDKKIHDSLYLEPIQSEFIAARGVSPGILPIDSVDMMDFPCYGMSGQSGEQMIALVKQAQQKGALLVFLFHGVGGEHAINVSVEAHSALLQYVALNKIDIWNATLLDVAEFIAAQRTHR
jgi:peptidoglycan/xylan/chitin deacetylase (PgdA/CDA1 family)